MNTPPISTILRRQKPDACWPGANLYGQKYEGTHWANLLLVEYGVDPGDPRVRRAARFVLEALASPGRGGMDWIFNRDHGASCVIGSVVRYVAMAGYGADSRLEPLVQRLVRDSKKFDAECWINGDLPCGWGYARLVWGLAALPESARTREVQRTLRRGVEFLLSFRVERGRYPTDTARSYLWRQLSFLSSTKPTSSSSFAHSMRPARSTTTARSPRSVGFSRARTREGGGAGARLMPRACPRGWTRASGSPFRRARSSSTRSPR